MKNNRVKGRHLSSEPGGMEEYVVDGNARDVARGEQGRGCLVAVLCFVLLFMVWEMFLLENVEGEW